MTDAPKNTPAAMPDWFTFYFCWNGRITRKQYWLNYVLTVFLIGIAFGVLDAMLKLSFVFDGDEYGPLSFCFMLFATTYSGTLIGIKRLHDRNKSGWLIEVGFLRGTKGLNRFGPDPLEK